MTTFASGNACATAPSFQPRPKSPLHIALIRSATSVAETCRSGNERVSTRRARSAASLFSAAAATSAAAAFTAAATALSSRFVSRSRSAGTFVTVPAAVTAFVVAPPASASATAFVGCGDDTANGSFVSGLTAR